MDYKENIDIKKLPRHIAIIMDGNGRWARQKGFLRAAGHEEGTAAVRDVVEASAEIGIEYLTLYAITVCSLKLTVPVTLISPIIYFLPSANGKP